MGTKELPSNSDFVVFGALRSGSTLLRLMINAHPSLCCNGEHDFLFDYVIFEQSSGKWLLDREKLSTDRNFISQDLPFPETNDAKAAIRELMDSLKTRAKGNLVIIIHRNLEPALSLLNNPLIVHLIRDPRDVAASSIGMGWAGNVYYGVDHWITTEDDWMKTSPKLPISSIFTLPFEQLIAEPTFQLQKLCKFYGLKYSSEMLEYHRSTTYEPVNPSLANQWKQKRTKGEIALIELKVGTLLEASGYTPSGVSPLRLNYFKKFNLWFENKSYTWRARTRRHGFFDWVWVALARRLGLESWAKAAKLRMADRTKSYLK